MSSSSLDAALAKAQDTLASGLLTNEAGVQASVIRPILRELGWDDADPQQWQVEYQVDSGLGEFRRFDLPLYVTVPWLRTPDRLELLDLALSQEPDYIRAHRPAQVREHHAALTAAS